MMQNDFLAESANIEELVEEAEGMNILTSRKDGPVTAPLSNSVRLRRGTCRLVFDKYSA